MSRVTVWLPNTIIRKTRRVAPRRKRGNLGCIIVEALKDYVVKRKEEAFDRGVRRMAKDTEFMKAMRAPYPEPAKRGRRRIKRCN